MKSLSPKRKQKSLEQLYPPVAQLDNAADSDSEDQGFESLRAGFIGYYNDGLITE